MLYNLKNTIIKYILCFLFSSVLFSQGDYSLSFDGVDDYVEFNTISPFNSSESISLEAIFKWNGPNGVANEQYIVQFAQSGPGNASLTITDEGILRAVVLQCNCQSDTDNNLYYALEQGIWYHVIFSYDTSTGNIKLYINGNIVDSGNYPFISYYNVNNSPSRLGNYHFNSHYFNGNISFAQIVNDVIYPNQNSIHENAIGYWNFNSGSGNILYDQSENQNHGTIYGDAVWVSYEVLGCTDTYASNYNEAANIDDGSCTYPDNGDYSLSFDGVDDYVEFNYTDLYDISGDFTWEGNFKIEDIDSNYLIFEQNSYYNLDGYFINYWGGGNFEKTIWFSICSNSTCYQYYGSPNPVQNDTWFHLAIIKESNNIKIYIDGEDITYGTVNLNDNNIMDYYVPSTENLCIGADIASPWPAYYNGKMNRISLWNAALTEDEINSLNNQELINEEYLVSYWKFDEGSGTILYDYSENENHGTIYGAQWEENEVLGCTDTYAVNYNDEADIEDGSCEYPNNGIYSLYFDGNDDYVDLGNSDIFSPENFSITSFFNLNSSRGARTIIGRNASSALTYQYSLQVLPENRIQFTLASSDDNLNIVLDDLTLENNIWYNTAGTYGNNMMKLYVDGDLRGEPTQVSSMNVLFVNTFIGKYRISNSEGSHYFKGNIDEVMFWDRELSQVEINEIINTSSANINNGLFAHYKFNAGEGNILYDHSGNGNHATIHGAVWVEYNLGDVTLDGDIDIVDIVVMVDYILGSNDIHSIQFEVSDVYSDGSLTVSDIILLIEMILAD